MLEQAPMKSDPPQLVESFFNAIRQGNAAALEGLLATPMMNIDVLDEEGMTGLGIAAQYGLTDVIAILLKNKANINAKDKKGKTALLIAAENAKHLVAAQLLSNHADPELADYANNTPLSYALYNRSLLTMKALLQHNADQNKPLQIGPYKGLPPLHAAMVMNCISIFELLYKYRNNSNAANTLLLSVAIRIERLECIKILWPQLSFDNKVQVINNSTMENKINILEYALAHTTNEERQKAFHSLIEGVTPLTFCFKSHHLNTARLLLAYGHELIKKNDKTSEAVIISKLGNKEWQNMLEDYYNNIKRHEKTPTLTEMTANKVYQSAIITKTPIKDLGLPQELETLCYIAPSRLHIQSALKPQHVKDFLKNLFQSETDMDESIKEIKHKNDKRAKKQ
jgi:ankyrin repeat protein